MAYRFGDVVYIVDRADSTVCAVDEKTLARKKSGHIDHRRTETDGEQAAAPCDEIGGTTFAAISTWMRQRDSVLCARLSP